MRSHLLDLTALLLSLELSFVTADSSSSDETMSSGLLIGIIVACVVLLLALTAAVIIFVICRRRRLAAKTPQRRHGDRDIRDLHDAGCSFPADIPVQPIVRELPPPYASVDDLSTTSTVSHRQDSSDIAQPPPPYSVQTSGDVAIGGYRADESLTLSEFDLDASRRSRSSGIILQASSPRVAPRAGSASAGRLRSSIDSLSEEYTGMFDDILLTSSRSSLPTSSDSAGAAAVPDAVLACGPGSPTDSARGDSIDSWPSGEHRRRRSTNDPPQRSTSMTHVAVAHGGSGSRRQDIPECGLQRQARRHAAGAPPPRTTSLDHGISMDPGASASRDDVTRRRRAHAESREHHRRRDQQQAGRRYKSRSSAHMTTVDEEQTTSSTPAFIHSVV